MRKLFSGLLGFLARQTVHRFHPAIIAITGTVGKTSTKDAIAIVAALRGTTRKNAGNLNNEIGVPLTVFGKRESSGLNPFFWLGVFLGALGKIIRGGKYPEFLVLEMAADHPGDIAYLTWIAKPTIGVVTAISPVHMQFYPDIAAVTKEKFGVIAPLGNTDIAVLNSDDARVKAFAKETKAHALLFGTAADADVRITSVEPTYGPALASGSRKSVLGSTVHLAIKEMNAGVFLQGVLGDVAGTSVAAAAAVGYALHIPLDSCAQALSQLRLPPGRMRLLEGTDDILIVDDSYNASPAAVVAALRNVAALNPSINRSVRRYAVFGHMAELGIQAEQYHAEMGRAVAEAQFDGLVVLGEFAHVVAAAAEAGGMTQERLFVAKHHEEAVAHIRTMLEPGDIVLIKGSQAARMEAIAAALLADPSLAGNLLVRQTPVWQKTRPVIRLHITE